MFSHSECSSPESLFYSVIHIHVLFYSHSIVPVDSIGDTALLKRLLLSCLQFFPLSCCHTSGKFLFSAFLTLHKELMGGFRPQTGLIFFL